MTFIDNSAKTNWKFIGIVAVIAILIGGGILVLSSQKETPPQFSEITKPGTKPSEELPVDETASWQTYRNEEFDFEGKYPETWFILNTFLEGKVVEFRDSQWDKEPKIDGASMVIDSYKDVQREEVLRDTGFQTREEAIKSGEYRDFYRKWYEER